MNLYKLFFLGLFLLFSQIVMSQENGQLQAKENTIIETIPFVLTDHNNISIKAILNKKDTLDLMFHTAVGSVSLIKDVTKELTSINWSEPNKAESWGGGENTSRSSENNVLKIGESEWDDITLWDCEHSGPLTDGKFGLNLFEGKIIEINFDQNVVVIHKSLPVKSVKYEKLKLDYDDGFMFISGISISGDNAFTNKYLIHSGYAGSVLYDDEFVKSSKIGEQLEIIDEKELKDSYGNVLKVKKAVLPSFKIGEMEFNDMPVGFFEGAIGRQKMSVLGGDILKRFNMIIDAEMEYIYIKPNGLNNLPYSKV